MAATNVVSIAIDDLFAYAQFRDSFGVTIETPNLDKLMARSVNFENAYAAVAICAPSRAATMTGLTPFQTGAHDNFTYVFDTVDPQDSWPALIRDNGYFATGSGKVFHSKASTAVQSVYSETIVFAGSTLRGAVERTEGGRPWEYLGPDEDFSDNKVATFGIEFLDRAPADQPFLLTLGFDHPHTSYKAPARFYDLYPFDEIRVPTDWVNGDLSDAPAFAQQFASQPRGGEPFSNLQAWKTTVQGYLASVTHMDHEVGRFLDALEASEYAASTAIVVYSDHGYQLGNKDHPVKFTLWEESAKAPLMIYHPDGAQGTTVSTPVSLMDIFPTMTELTGTATPDGLTGQSLLSFVIGDGSGYVEKPALTSMYGSFGIRSGDYRYIRYQDGSEELYDVIQDPGQIMNLATLSEHRELALELRSALLDAARESGAIIDETAVTLTGTDGNDQGVASPTNDVVALGDGDDSYQVFGNTAEIIETAGGGYDTVYYIGTEAYRMPENVERFFIALPDNRLDMASVYGNDGDEEYHTGFTSGLIYAGGGDDRAYGGGWVNHTFYGGSGDDTLTGWKYNDFLDGGVGNDSLNGWDRNDRIFGGDGIDLISGGRGNDLLSGGDGDDLIRADNDRDVIHGDGGDDQLFSGNGDDVAYGGAGADRLTSDAGDDLLDGGLGDDVYFIRTGAGHRIIAASDGVDEISMPTVARTDLSVLHIGDTLHLYRDAEWSVLIEGVQDSLNDTVIFADQTVTVGELLATAETREDYFAGYGDQTIVGAGASNDLFLGLYGDDLLDGKSGDDSLFGGHGDDTVSGNWGRGFLFGGDGNDTVSGKGDDDTLSGDAGDDRLIGGDGNDLYLYSLGDGNDLIVDGGGSESDRLEVSGVSASDVIFSTEGRNLIIQLPDGGSITLRDHLRVNGQIEGIAIGDDETIIGSDTDDLIFSGAGADTLHDGNGRDGLTGGAGSDVFVLSADGEQDWVKDFQIGIDKLDLNAWGVTSLGQLDIAQHSAGKAIITYGSEVLTVNDGTWTLDANQLTIDSFVGLTEGSATGQVISGSAAGERLVGGGGDDTITDGGGRDGLYGRSGADTFVLVADGDFDWVNDFEVGTDILDLSAWGATGIGDLDILQHDRGKAVIRFTDEVLTVNDGTWTLDVSTLTEDSFLF